MSMYQVTIFKEDMMNKPNKYQPKQFVASDHMKTEQRWLNRAIVASVMALILFVGFCVGAYFDAQNHELYTQIQEVAH